MPQPPLWAPWRMDYICNLDKPAPPAGAANKPPAPDAPPACFLCDLAKLTPGTDAARKNLLIHANEHGMLLLNKFPYSNGHLLIAPRQHLADLLDLTPPHRAGLIELVALGERLLRDAFNPQGVNIGANLGRCAGAGVPGHLHFHIVPRWSGDVNFMSTIGNIRVIPQALEESFAYLAQTFKDTVRA